MPNVRIYEVAKRLGKSSADIIEKCNQMGIEANGNFSSLSDKDASRLLDSLSGASASGSAAKARNSAEANDKADISPTPKRTPSAKSLGDERGGINIEPAEQAQAVNRPRPRPEGEGAPERRPRPRPEGEGAPERRPRPRPEGEGAPERRPRPRPEGEGAPERRPRPRPEGEGAPERRPRPRPEGEGALERRPRPRPEGEGAPERRPRPRLEGEGAPERRPRPRPEGEGAPERRPRPRPEGEGAPERRLRPRPEGEGAPERRLRPRPEGEGAPERRPRPRPEGEGAPERRLRPRPEGEGATERRPRPDGAPDAPERHPRPRPEGATGAPERHPRPRPEGESASAGISPQRPETADRQQRPRETQQRYIPKPYTGEITELKPEDRRPQQRPEFKRPFTGGQKPEGQQRDGGGRPGGRPGGSFGAPRTGGFGAPRTGSSGGGPRGSAPKLTQMQKPESRAPRGEGFKKERDKDKKREGEPFKPAQKPGTKYGKAPIKPARPQRQKPLPPKEEKIEITYAAIPANITVKNFAEVIGRNTSVIIKTLMKNGVMVNLNQEITFEVAQKVGEQLNILIDLEEEKDILEEMFKDETDDEKDLVERPPVVVVMGHVDHGKTSLLDAIRDASVQSSEAGGITQHIGAYTTQINNRSITFLDTPGHEAFTAMRMRGASITDIAVLVVAADDGVMPQTIEAINHAKAAGVDIVVAINKIDKPSANPDRVKQELTEHGLLVEEWGGETVCVHVSAKAKTNLDKLLEMILLVADIKELKANPNKRAKGTVVEALLDKGRGPVATVLIQEGTLNIGDSIVAGSCYGKVRAMTDDKGKRVKKAGPSKPVEIIGLSEAPKAGDMLYAAENDRQARQITETIIAKDRLDMTRASVQKISLDDLFNQIKAGNVKDLNIVIKADVQGSVEAVKQSLERLSNEEVKIRTIHGGVGAINESDVMLAAASNAIIIGFNVRPEPAAKSVAEEQNVDLRLYRVIYNAIEDINAAIKGMLDPIFAEKVTGHAEIRQIFKASGIGTIGGSHVTDGTITRSAKVRIMRNSVVVYEGELESLKRFKDDVKEVASGYECGLLFNKFNDIKEGDIVEAFVMEEIER